MPKCGRIRRPVTRGWNDLVRDELTSLRMGVLALEAGDRYSLSTDDREYACVLIEGMCRVCVPGWQEAVLGPRRDPFADAPSAVLLTREEELTIEASSPALLGIGSAPAPRKMGNALITPDQVRSETRGSDNWTRLVRKICWSDNTEGNQLLAGETCTPSGNWSSVPPHRHQYYVEEVEVPYEEIYFFRFSRPQGFGLVWQFDDDGGLDQAFSVRTNDAVYHDAGYHPVVGGPGAALYHLTFMAGPYRRSSANVHPDYRYMLDEQGQANPFTPGGR